jgi:hypothetical protein
MNLSLLVHTCDSYSKYWPGMLYSLDFNWDFKSVPVYWSSEELGITNYSCYCKDIKYFPNKNINELLVGKTDKNGFSNRLKKSLELIPTKWVIYIQEDMWILSKLPNELLSKLLLFCELKNVDSLKIHTKLFYYNKYKLEPTNFKIDNTMILKYSKGDNFLHSHNATIWNREYLINHTENGEDPWINEINGSKRMSSKENNHYHYNIHWYSQPGVCDMGNNSPDFNILSPLLDEKMYMKLKYN